MEFRRKYLVQIFSSCSKMLEKKLEISQIIKKKKNSKMQQALNLNTFFKNTYHHFIFV